MRRIFLAAMALGAFGATRHAAAAPPDGLGVLRVLGPHATSVLAPKSGTISALVAIPEGKRASDFGVIELVPGVGQFRGSPASVLAYGAAHPDAHVEVAPPLHALLANAQLITRAALARTTRNADGSGAVVAVVDTGIDPTRPDFRDPVTQKSRIAWMLDLSMKPLGLHPDVEAKFDVTDGNGQPLGAVLTGQDIDDLISQANPVPIDPNGHGTHVASIAAGNGGGTAYIGMAPNAALVIARVSRDASGTFENGDILDGASFVFDRADALGKPLVANFSFGTDFGPHDGNSLWEQTLASYAGSDKPGRVIVAAAGNSGSIVDSPVHQGVAITGTRVRIPVVTEGAKNSGAVQIWVAIRAGAELKVGLDGPDGTWISPISEENESAHNQDGYNSGVIYGTTVPNTPVPPKSHGAIVLWSGKWPAGTYAVTLEGHGYADLYLEGLGDAALAGSTPAFFPGAVRDATVTLPATSSGIIGVGCSIDSPTWLSQSGQKIGITEPVLDLYGGLAQGSTRQTVGEGDICYFSSAGPTLTGLPKPDILAPGAVVIGAMSQEALPGSPNSIFTSDCPPDKNTGHVDPTCMQVDPGHAAALGTSMSSPMVAGVVALLLAQDPTLTQDEVRALLQAGAHRVRGKSGYFFDQAGPGELDAFGALEALDEMSQPDAALPDAAKSWLALSEDVALADGSTPITATLELRSAGDKRATLFDVSRLHAIALLGTTDLAPTIVRSSAPGLFTFTVAIPPGRADEALTLGATFDGAPIVQSAIIPVAVDSWTAGYPPFAQGGCNASHSRAGDAAFPLLLVGLLVLRRRAR